MKRLRPSATRVGTVLIVAVAALVAIGLLAWGPGAPGPSASKAERSGGSLAAAGKVASAEKAPASVRDKGDKKSKDPAPIEPTPTDPPAPPADPPPATPADPPVTPVDPPATPTDPPAVPEEPPAPEPEAPPVVPVEPPVTPDPETPPPPPAAPGATAAVSCVSSDMADIITFEPPTAGLVSTYTLLAASEEDGEYTAVATAGADARSFTRVVFATGTAFYRIGVTGPGGEGPLSGAVSNAQVLITADVPPSGATLRASNGEVVLSLPEGAFATTTTVTVSEVAGSPRGNLISLAGVYDITPSGALGAPATLSVAYSSPVAHHEVSAALLASAGLMTYDEGVGAWMNGASGITADGTYLSGTLDHFSYWTGATIQPHGTSTTAYCSSGGICHDLSTYPGSTARYSSRDSQVCYNCHGNTDAALPPAGANPLSPNIQAELFQVTDQVRPAGASTHPVATGDLYCTACHDPHADPAASPGLLKSWNPTTGTYVQGGAGTAPGTDFCWTCHGAIKNRRVDYLVPGYYTASGGDKKTAFNGAHTALSPTMWRFDSAEELRQGSSLGTQVLDGGTVENTFEQVRLSKDPVAVPSPAFQNGAAAADKPYDGDWSSTGGAVWYAGLNLGASAATGWVATGTVTIDLGSATEVRAFECVSTSTSGRSAHVLEIRTSDTGLAGSFVPLVSQGTLGTGLPYTTTLTASARCRYVQFVFTRQFATASDRLDITELSVFGFTPGTFTVQPDIARKAAYGSGVVKWGATGPASASVTVDARLSTNSGVSWSAWQPVTNGGPLMPDKAGGSLEFAQMEVRTTLPGTPGATAALDWIEVTTTRGDITGTTPQWTGESPANECQRCHSSHGSEDPGLVAEGTTSACTNCHAAALGGYAGAVQFGVSAHKNVDCAECHTSHGYPTGPGTAYAYLLEDLPRDACLDCHTDVKAAFDAKQGVGAERAKHDVYSAEQVTSGSRLGCDNCHSTHSSANGLVNPDTPTQAYDAVRYDPASIPTSEVVIYPSMDTIVDSSNPSLNYGQSTQGTITPTSRALFYFDLSVIPAGATIQNATLVMWPSNPADVSSVDHYVVYPVTAAWREGTGTGTVNDAAVNGATWLEREYALSWATAGGDRGAMGPLGIHSISPRNITDMVQSLYVGPNYGLMVAPHPDDPSTSLPIYMDEYAGANSAKYRPRLRIVYQTGPGTETVLDDEAFCLKCHDNDLPLNLQGIGGITRINTSWSMYSIHGDQKGIGPSYANNDSGSLKAPYSWGMDALPCGTCHDPHGSRLPFHLRENVNGRDMTPVLSSGWTSASASTVPAYFCGACHVLPASHPGDVETPATLCSGLCHSAGH